MMNELVICTERGIYSALEHVIGIVYLKVYHPSQINGLQLQLVGTLHVEFQENIHEENVIDETFILSQIDEPYSIGYHAFPFMITLPPNLSGSMFIENLSGDVTYRLETSYRLIVRAQNSKSFLTETCIYIYRHNLDEIWEDENSSLSSNLDINSSTTSSFISPTILSQQNNSLALPQANTSIIFGQIRKTEVTMYIRINKPVFEFGESISLDIQINNKAARLIESISVKFIRCVEVNLPKTTKSVIESVLWGHLEPSIPPDCKEKQISITVPIPTPSCQEFAPTTCNAYFKCYHVIDIRAPIASTGSNRPQLQLRLRVPCIVPHDNPFWSQKQLPYWCERAIVGSTHSSVQIPRPHVGALFFAPTSVLEHFGISKY